MKYFYAIPLLTVALFTNISAASNQQIFTPESILPAGVDESIVVNPYTGESGKARKGTVAATINNIALLNKLLLKPQTEVDSKKIQEITKEIDTLIPSLNVLGLFDFFSVKEWLSDYKTQPGRVLTAALYLKHYPGKIDTATKKLLDDIHRNTAIFSLKHEISEINFK